MGRGSVGDVTFYRANGQQLARARNRSPRNPKTDAQLIQRAISATISQAYKAGKIIFDHSFEGKEVPAGNQRRFLSVNMRKLRDQVISELAVNEAGCIGAVVSPGAVSVIPNAYRISEGTLIQNLFTISVTDNMPTAVMAAANTGEKVSEYAARLGLQPGEIFTIVGIGNNNGVMAATDLVSAQFGFGFVRLIVKESVTTDATAMTSANYGNFFTMDASGTTFPEIQAITEGVALDQIVGHYGCMGVIRSNENSGLRSTCDMVTPLNLSSSNANTWGVKSSNLLEAWQDASAGLQSPLILEGGGF